MDQPDHYFIMMADIKGSSAKSGDPLMKTFKLEVKKVNQQLKDRLLSPFTITLGDEFQGVVKDLVSAVEVIFFLDQQLLKNDPVHTLRYVVNYGVIETPINPVNAYEMLGPGLTQARTTLNALKKKDAEVNITGVEGKLCYRLNLAFELYRSIYNYWNHEAREIAASFLELSDYRLVAKQFGRDPSSIWRREKSLKIREFLVARALIKDLADG